MRHRAHLPYLLFAALSFLLLAASPAHAEPAVSATVDLSWLTTLVVNVAIGVVGAFLSKRLHAQAKVAGLEQDTMAGAILDVAIRNGLDVARAKAGKVLSTPGASTFDVHSAVLAEAIRYVSICAQGVLTHFGITEDRLRDMILARLVSTAAPDSALLSTIESATHQALSGAAGVSGLAPTVSPEAEAALRSVLSSPEAAASRAVLSGAVVERPA